MSEDRYAIERLIWVEKRLEILESVDRKLQKMKEIAEYARDHELSQGEKTNLNIKINILEAEVKVLYRQEIVVH